MTFFGMKWTCRSTSPGRPRSRQSAGTSASCICPPTGGPPAAGPLDGPALDGPAHRVAHLLARVALGQALALVVRLAALAERELDLRPAVLEVQRERDERQPALLGLADQAQDLL